MDARARLSLSREATWGQMIRGGRSWPPEWKSGEVAEIAGNETDVVETVASTGGGANASGDMQQALAQAWQAGGCPPDAEVS